MQGSDVQLIVGLDLNNSKAVINGDIKTLKGYLDQKNIKIKIGLETTASAQRLWTDQITASLNNISKKGLFIRVSEVKLKDGVLNNFKKQLETVVNSVSIDKGYSITLGSKDIGKIVSDVKQVEAATAEATARLAEFNTALAGIDKFNSALSSKVNSTALGLGTKDLAIVQMLREEMAKVEQAAAALKGKGIAATPEEVARVVEMQNRMQQILASVNEEAEAKKKAASEAERAAKAAEKEQKAAEKAAAAEQKRAQNAAAKAKAKEMAEAAAAEAKLLELQTKVEDLLAKATKSGMDKINLGKYDELKGLLDRIKTAIGEIGKDNTSGAANNVKTLTSEYKNLKGVVDNLTKSHTGFWSQLGGAFKSQLSMLVGYAAIARSVIQSTREMITAAVDLDTAMTQLKIVTNETDDVYKHYAESLSDMAQRTGTAIADLTDSTTTYARLGYSLEESSKLSELTAKLQNVGAIDVKAAQDAMTAIVKAYDVGVDDVESVMDRLVKVGNNAPISVAEIAEGMNNAGSALHAAGNSFDKSVALLTAANTTVQNISKSSTGLRTIAARIRKTKTELDDLGEEMTDAKYQELVKALSDARVSITDDNGQFRDTYDILQDIAAVWDTLTSMQQAALIENLAGSRQQNVFTSIIEQFREAQLAMDLMANSEGELQRANDEYMNSIQAHINTFKEKMKGIGAELFTRDFINSIIDLGSILLSLVDIIADVINAFGGLKVVLPIALAAFGRLEWLAIANKLLGENAKEVKGAAKAFHDMGKKVGSVVTTLVSLFQSLWAVILAHPYIALAAAVTTAIGIIVAKHTGLFVSYEKQVEKVNELNAEYDEMFGKGSRYDELINQTRVLTDEEREELAVLKALKQAREEELKVETQREYDKWRRRQTTDVREASGVHEGSILDILGYQNGSAVSLEVRRYSELAQTLADATEKYNAHQMTLEEYSKVLAGQIADGQDYYNELQKYEMYGLTDYEKQFKAIYDNAIQVYGSLDDAKLQAQRALDEYVAGQKSRGKTDDEIVASSAYKELLNTVLDLDSGLVKATSSASMLFSVLQRKEIVDIFDEYNQELTTAKELSTVLGTTYEEISRNPVFGNIDLNNRGEIVWTPEQIKLYKNELESLNIEASELEGSISTVLGSYSTFTSSKLGDIDIAFSPMLQTDKGAQLLSLDTIYDYIDSLISHLDNDPGEPTWSLSDLVELDAEGLEIDGRVIKGLIAGMGNDADAISQLMHYFGKNGSIAEISAEMESLGEELGYSTEQLKVFYDLITERNTSVNSLKDGIEAANKALEQFNTLSAVDNSAAANNYAEAYKKFTEAWDAGKIGSNTVRAAIDLYIPEEIQQQFNYDTKQLGEMLSSGIYKEVFGGEGKDYAKNFFDYIEANIGDLQDVVRFNRDGDNYTFGYESIGTLADALGLSKEALSALLSAVQDYSDVLIRSDEDTRNLADALGLIPGQVEGSKEKIQEFANSIAQMDQFAGIGESQLMGLLQSLEEAGFVDLSKVRGELSQIANIALNTTGSIKDVDKVEANPEIKVEGEEAKNILDTIYGSLESINGYRAVSSVTTNHFDNYYTSSQSSDSGGISTHLSGKFGAKAGGTSNSPGGKALVNELGPELISANGEAYIANGGAPAVVDLPAGAIVIPADKTKDALNYSGVNRNAKKIKAYASGNPVCANCGSKLTWEGWARGICWNCGKNPQQKEVAKLQSASTSTTTKGINSTTTTTSSSNGFYFNTAGTVSNNVTLSGSSSSGGGSTGGGGSSGGSSSSGGSGGSSNANSWFAQQYKEHKHLIEMDKEEQADFLAWLNDAYKKAYGEGILTLDDYRKYEEEVYKGLHDLFKEGLKDKEHEIDMLEKEGDSANQIFNIYQQLIAQIQGEINNAYAQGLNDNDDYIQDLQKKLWSYKDAIDKLRKDAEKGVKDSVEDMVEYRIKMLKKELENEKKSYNDRLSQFKDFIDGQKKLLTDAAKQDDYLEQQAEKRKAVSDIENQITEIQFDNSAWGQRRRLELEESLAKARKDLADFEKDYALEQAQNELDTIYNITEDAIKKQTDLIEEKLDNQKYLYETALHDVQVNGQKLFDEMVAYEEKYGSGQASAVKEMWEEAYVSLANYAQLYGQLYKGISLQNVTGYGATPLSGTGYASGTSSATPGLHKLFEQGDEYIFTSSNGSTYRMFNGSGDKVLNSRATNFLYKFANSMGAVPNIGKWISGFGGVSQNNSPVEINMGDIVINGNADEKTVSEIRRENRANVKFMLSEFMKLKR